MKDKLALLLLLFWDLERYQPEVTAYMLEQNKVIPDNKSKNPS